MTFGNNINQYKLDMTGKYRDLELKRSTLAREGHGMEIYIFNMSKHIDTIDIF